jgi:hypothetical protein
MLPPVNSVRLRNVTWSGTWPLVGAQSAMARKTATVNLLVMDCLLPRRSAMLAVAVLSPGSRGPEGVYVAPVGVFDSPAVTSTPFSTICKEAPSAPEPSSSKLTSRVGFVVSTMAPSPGLRNRRVGGVVSMLNLIVTDRLLPA